MSALLFPSNAPRSSFNVQEFYDRVRGDLALRGSARITDADLLGWGNEGAREIARETWWLRAKLTTDLVANQARYAWPDTTDGRCIGIESVFVSGQPVRAATIDDLNKGLFNWPSQTGSPPWLWWTNGGTDLQLWPTPASNQVGVLDLSFYAVPPDVTAPQEHFMVPFGGERALLVYAKKLASEKDAFGEGARRAQGYEAEWLRLLVSMKRQVRNTNPNAVTAVGEDALADGPPYGGRLPFFTNIGL